MKNSFTTKQSKMAANKISAWALFQSQFGGLFIVFGLIFGGMISTTQAANIIVVKGEVDTLDSGIVAQDLEVIVTNPTRNKSQKALITGSFFQCTFLDFAASVAEVGDLIQVVAKQPSGVVVAREEYVLSQADIAAAVAEINCSLSTFVTHVLPKNGQPPVPNSIYMELGFSQSMDPGSMEASVLQVTDLTGGVSFPVKLKDALEAVRHWFNWTGTVTIPCFY